mgnify:FL=1
MHRLHIIVEGQTEEDFVNNILSPHLLNQKINPVHSDAFLFRGGGGSLKFEKCRKVILDALKQDKAVYITTMVDFYKMPPDWPGRNQASHCKKYQDKAATVENALSQDILNQPGPSFNKSRFIPYVQMHEFEALLFSDTSKLAKRGKKPAKISAQLERVLQSFSCPEEINDNDQSHPSLRIKQHIKDYDKRVDGILVAREIGLPKMRHECPHFNEWITKLEDIGNQ